ncbi:hypothetical protein HPULCUR_007114 [Helicostylum pulchrum]|uniref:PH domain-containing protein n=1 Tax=Helicostylum pulchrum TaxID=562976 RepID=A0ABP9Y509_9FUNG
MSNEFPPTIDDKEIFRLSIASQQSSTTTTTVTSNSSSQRLSVVSTEDDNHVAYSPSVATRSSSRYLLSSPPSTENFRSRVLNRFISSSSSRHQKSLSEYSFDSIVNNSLLPIEAKNCDTVIIDPWCMSVKYALEHAINSDWLHKYEQPSTFGFGRSWKRRLFVLVDRIVYIFKTSKSTNPAREHFLLTDDTFVFVTEEFKKGFIIELRKPLCKWYIRCESVNQMRQWLESMKKIVACIKIGYDGVLSSPILSSIRLTDDYRILIPTAHENSKRLNRQSLPTMVTTRPSTPSSSLQLRPQRQSLTEIPDWESTLPPQLPPPRSKPPPVPPCLPTVSEDY